jgi:hypothetical protein
MFERNILTFNPGWDPNARKLATFTDVRELQRQLKAQGVQLANEADESTTGPASFIVAWRLVEFWDCASTTTPFLYRYGHGRQDTSSTMPRAMSRSRSCEDRTPSGWIGPEASSGL